MKPAATSALGWALAVAVMLTLAGACGRQAAQAEAAFAQMQAVATW